MNIQLEIALIGLMQAIVVAIIGGMFAMDSRKRKKHCDEADKRAELRKEESLLAIRLMSASVHVGIESAKAIRDQRANGELTVAIEQAQSTERVYEDFMRKVTAESK